MTDSSFTLDKNTIVAASKDQVSCDLGEEAAILGLKNSVYYGLNPLGAQIWRLLQEPRSIEEICRRIVSEYDVTRERAESDLLHLLQQMLSEGLVELRLPEGVRETSAQ